MFKNEIKNAKMQIFKSEDLIDDELVNIKIAIHDLEKLGFDTKELEKQLENVGIEIYKFKKDIREFNEKVGK